MRSNCSQIGRMSSCCAVRKFGLIPQSCLLGELMPGEGLLTLLKHIGPEFGLLQSHEAFGVDATVKLRAAVANFLPTLNHAAKLWLIATEHLVKETLGIRTPGYLTESPSVQLAGEAGELALLEVVRQDIFSEALRGVN